MAKFQIEINLGNDAFANDERGEIARILEHVANLLKKYNMHNMSTYTLFDINGNDVGKAKRID